jgi:peptidoglycan LD-endopeptidase LytH
MQRFKTLAIILVTALVTSLFWIVVYNGAGGRGDAAVTTAAIADQLPPGFGAPPRQPTPPGVDLNAPYRPPVTGPAPSFRPAPTAPLPLVATASGLVIPVVGKQPRDLVDTYTASRSGGRVHNAIDIMAARGTPVVAAAAGTVEKLFRSDAGGITLYVRSPDRRWSYYYAHLAGYAPGMREGRAVRAGELLGQVGDTGNAGAGNTHLHFAVNRMGAGDRWHQGEPVNPYPLLAAAATAR